MDSGAAFSTLTSGFQMLINLAASVFTIIGMWTINTKAGYNGWEALIPVYNMYVLFRISGKKKLFGWYLALMIADVILSVLLLFTLIGSIAVFTGRYYIGDYNVSGSNAGLAGMWGGMLLVFFLLCIASIGIFIVNIFMCIGLVHSFGLNGGYAVGLILLPYVFYPIIGLSKSIQYVGSDRGKNFNPSPQYYQNGNQYNGGQYYGNGTQNYSGQYSQNGNYSGQNNNGQYDMENNNWN